MYRPRIVWEVAGSRAPAAPMNLNALESLGAELPFPFLGAVHPSLGRLAKVLQRSGIPRVESASTPKEDAIGLLMLAAEIEHALMVQYLYAVQSTRGVAKRKISHIAVQEMGHLVTVQNLLIALTGIGPEAIPTNLHVGRDELRRQSTHNPLPFVLEPLSHDALAKFVVVERPATIGDPVLSARVDVLEAGLHASGIDPNPVSALYAAIRWLFQADDLAASPLGQTFMLGFEPEWHIADADFADATATTPFMAEPSEWGSVPGLLVMVVTDRTSALAAIDAITEQGEGAPGGDESHFEDFVAVLDKLEAGELDIETLPRTPFVASQPVPEDIASTPISNPYAELWGTVFNAVYDLLVTDIGWSLSNPRGPRRSGMIDVCLDTMNELVQPLARHMTTLPLGEDPSVVAGPPYGLIHQVVPTTLSDHARRYVDVLAERDAAISRVRAHPEFVTDAGGQTVLATIQRIDIERSRHLPQGV